MGETVRELDELSQDVGINRVWWDLTYDRTTEPKLRTSPRYAPWVELGDEGWRSAPGLGRMAVTVPPGTYTVKLTVGDWEFTQPIEVRKDPNSLGSESDIAAQTTVVLELRDHLNQVVDMVNAIEVVRSQLYALNRLLQDDESAAVVVEASAELDEKLIAVEEQLHQMKLTGRGQDAIRWPAMLGQQISYLAGKISLSDLPPTDQQLEVKQVIEQELSIQQAEFARLMAVDVPAFNEMLAQRGLQGIITP